MLRRPNAEQIFATFILLISSATFAYGIQADTEWVKFTSPKGVFTLLAPHELKPDVESQPTDNKMSHERFNDFEEGYGFVIECFESVPVTDPEKYLNGTRDGILESLKGTLVSESKLSLDRHPGRELIISLTAQNGTVVLSRTRFYLVGNTMFSLSYVWRKNLDETLATKTGERFFSSVRIKPEQ